MNMLDAEADRELLNSLNWGEQIYSVEILAEPKLVIKSMCNSNKNFLKEFRIEIKHLIHFVCY